MQSEGQFYSESVTFRERMAKAGPILSRAAELDRRIEAGRDKIRDAENKGVSADVIDRAKTKLAGVISERATLDSEWLVEHTVRTHLSAFLTVIRDLGVGGTITVRVPGHVNYGVVVDSEPPF